MAENQLPAEVAHLLKVMFPVIIFHTIGVGMMWPAIPALLLGAFDNNVPRVAQYLARINAVSAILGFVSAPILGALSDSVGRRGILLMSLTIGCLCNFVIAINASPTAILITKFAFACTNVAKAMCYALLADTLKATEATKSEQVRAFGLIGMAVGSGFAAGPMIGGLVGLLSPQTTALVSSLFMAGTTILAAYTVDDTLLNCSDQLSLLRFPKICILCNKSAYIFASNSAFLFSLSFLLGGIASGPYSIWYVFAESQFGWNSFDSGLFLAGFGSAAVISQGFLLPWLVPQRLSERALLVLSFSANAALFCSYGVVSREHSKLLFMLLPLCMVGTLNDPLLRHIFSLLVASEDQGALQGVLAALSAVAGALGPLVAAQLLNFGQTSSCLNVLCHGAPFFFSCFLFTLASIASYAAFALESSETASKEAECGGHDRNQQHTTLLNAKEPSPYIIGGGLK